MTGQATLQRSDEKSSGEIRACWSCRGPTAGPDLFCPTCKALQPPLPLDYFQRLNLERAYDVDIAELDKNYFRYQRLLHPDRFATRTAKERALSLQHSTYINDAYNTLGDPLRRAEYLLSLHGKTVNTGAATIDDPELLTESIERREELAEADSAKEVDQILKRAIGDGDACHARLSIAFSKHDLGEAAQLAVRLKYLLKLVAEARVARTRYCAGLPLAAAKL